MVEQLQKHVPAKGRPPKLSLEDQVLLCLSYWREYRTFISHCYELRGFRAHSLKNCASC
ncbi:transposase family protein [Acinetobacter sp. SM34]|uniref:transposase family protein n=1 Tax=Acinetobacter sp. SM34 TaxID=1301620 RepID=UPI0022AA82FA|nr:transposase family protein [Acinetobacter sp. SM34]